MGLSGKLTVSESAVGGDGSDTSKEILETLKDIKAELSKNTKLQQTGFINQLSGFGGGAIGKILQLLGGTGLGLAVGAAAIVATPGDSRQGSTPLGYDQGIDSHGQNVYFEIDNKTGELLNVLTEQEARDKGILDEKGKIHDYLKTQNPTWKKITTEMGRYKDLILFTTENIDKIEALTSEEVSIRKSIIKALMKQYKQVSGKTFKQTYDDARYQETGQIQNEEQGQAAFQNAVNQGIYGNTGGLSPAEAILNNYANQRNAEASGRAEADRLIQSQLPLVDAVAYIR